METLKSILCLGDSATFGYPFEKNPESTYPARLQKILERRGGGFRVVNEGINGLTTQTLTPLLPKLLAQHQPDVVILMIGGNDMMQMLYANLGKPRPKVALPVFLRVQRLVNQIKSYVNLSGKTPQLIVSGYYAIDFMMREIVEFNRLLLDLFNVDLVTLENFGSFLDIEKAAARKKMFYDLAHPNQLGYADIAKNMAKAIKLIS